MNFEFDLFSTPERMQHHFRNSQSVVIASTSSEWYLLLVVRSNENLNRYGRDLEEWSEWDKSVLLPRTPVDICFVLLTPQKVDRNDTFAICGFCFICTPNSKQTKYQIHFASEYRICNKSMPWFDGWPYNYDFWIIYYYFNSCNYVILFGDWIDHRWMYSILIHFIWDITSEQFEVFTLNKQKMSPNRNSWQKWKEWREKLGRLSEQWQKWRIRSHFISPTKLV